MARNLLSDPADAQAGLATFGVVAGDRCRLRRRRAGDAGGHPADVPAAWIVVTLGIGVTSQLVMLATAALWSVSPPRP